MSPSPRRARIDRILTDIRSGENIDLYLSVVVSIALIVANLFGLVTEKYFVPVTMATIAILTYTVLGLKQAVRDFGDKIEPPLAKPPFQSEFPADFYSKLEAATEVWFSGTHLASVLTAYHEMLKRKLDRGGKLRFLLIQPDGTAAIMATKRFPGTVPLDQEKLRIETSLSIIENLRKIYPGQIEARVIDFPIEYTTYFLNPNSKQARIYVERSTYKISGGMHKPKFVYEKDDGKWYQHISNEVKLLWSDAIPWKGIEATPISSLER
ncbi:hypothetical protein [Rhizobium sp. ZPR3]|uniref:Uncharacterized protein n=2 Tax=unclassified Rhizobium TaxID=2613769 RepID=A0AAU7SF61_9HYPH